MPIKTLIERIRREHRLEATPPDFEKTLAQFQTRVGHALPLDMQHFYLACGGAVLFGDIYHILPLRELTTVNAAQLGDDGIQLASPCWHVFCDMQDGNYVGIDLTSVDGNSANILDCDHDQIGRSAVIARSFTEFLARALDSQGQPYFLQPRFVPYGNLVHEAPPSFYKQIYSDWHATLGPEIGPETCTVPQCRRLRIRLSACCRRHHYEQVVGRPCPFDD